MYNSVSVQPFNRFHLKLHVTSLFVCLFCYLVVVVVATFAVVACELTLCISQLIAALLHNIALRLGWKQDLKRIEIADMDPPLFVFVCFGYKSWY